MSRRLRLLWVSHSPLLETGFGRVTRELLNRLAMLGSIDVACLGLSAPGVGSPGADQRFKIYPGLLADCGQSVIEAAVNDFRPDLVVTLAELWMIAWLAQHPVRHQAKWLAYLPVDGGPFYPPWSSTLKETTGVVAMSRFGAEILKSGAGSKPLWTLYHGVDPNVFRPLDHRVQLKRHPRFEGKFIVGCVARNQPRKNIPALVEAFAMLSARYADLHLYLHCAPSESGYDLVHLLKRFGLQGKADLPPPAHSIVAGLADSQLNELYNLFDVMALPTCAEGFGIPILESMAAGVPVVATDCSACTELVRGRGELAAVKTRITLGENILEQAIVDVDDLARCIERLYRSPPLRAQYSEAGRAFAESLSWDRLIPQWLDVLGAAAGVDLRSSNHKANPVAAAPVV